MNRITVLLLAILCACGPAVQPTPEPPTPVLLTVTPGIVPTFTLTPAPIITVQPTPAPGGFRMPTARPLPVGSVDVTVWLCHEANYWWDVYPEGMTLHEDADGERACLGRQTP